MDLRGVVQLWELIVPGLGGQRVVLGALGAVVFWALGGALEWSAWGCGKSSGLCVVV